MANMKPFRLEYVEQQNHLRLPTITSILVVQNLYDILFQYLMGEEEENRLKELIQRMETHIKSKSRTPFSMPLEDLEFLGEGLEELKLLNWMEVPVTLFQIQFDAADDDISEANYEAVLMFLEDLMTIKRIDNSRLVYVYPSRLTAY